MTARAFGRKRNGFGAAQGDFVLPKGRSVSGLVHQVVALGLRQRGYTVVNALDSRAAQAAQLQVTIEQFWSYLLPSGSHLELDFVARLRIAGSLPGLRGGVVVYSKDQLRRGAISEQRWIELVERGLLGLSHAVALRIPTAPTYPSWN